MYWRMDQVNFLEGSFWKILLDQFLNALLSYIMNFD